MQTKAQEIAENIFNEIETDENGEEILRDLVDGVEPTTELKNWIEKAAEDADVDEQRVWDALNALASKYVESSEGTKTEEVEKAAERPELDEQRLYEVLDAMGRKCVADLEAKKAKEVA